MPSTKKGTTKAKITLCTRKPYTRKITTNQVDSDSDENLNSKGKKDGRGRPKGSTDRKLRDPHQSKKFEKEAKLYKKAMETVEVWAKHANSVYGPHFTALTREDQAWIREIKEMEIDRDKKMRQAKLELSTKSGPRRSSLTEIDSDDEDWQPKVVLRKMKEKKQ